MIQVIEHLSPQHVIDFVALAAEKLRPGGKVVIETVNPASLYTYARAFWVDPDHVRPVHPSFLEFLFREAEFSRHRDRVPVAGLGERGAPAAARRRSADAACSTRTSSESARCCSAPRTTPSSRRDDLDGTRADELHAGRSPAAERRERRGAVSHLGSLPTRRVRDPSDPRGRVARRRDHERCARLPRRAAPGRALRGVRPPHRAELGRRGAAAQRVRRRAARAACSCTTPRSASRRCRRSCCRGPSRSCSCTTTSRRRSTSRASTTPSPSCSCSAAWSSSRSGTVWCWRSPASRFNAAELEAIGYQDVRVIPPVVKPFRLVRTEPDPEMLNLLDRDFDAPLLLFVGQLLPHKRPGPAREGDARRRDVPRHAGGAPARRPEPFRALRRRDQRPGARAQPAPGARRSAPSTTRGSRRCSGGRPRS